ncbi:hypothetical protein PYW07_017026 [Mythimna separata]|uniref:Folded gastrulation N-terminal domain-containing protein n=1 Tax=Mythimna separata TaxID=271217 RepID=A0AAD7YVW6_MYTSE|nr:hypothetical protein PYW07_017026 [Mythimna separata]
MFVFVTTLEVIGLFSIRPTVYGLRVSGWSARYNVTGARRRASLLKVFAMWYTWTMLLLVSCALVKAETGAEGPAEGPAPAPVATTRAPPRTLDRKAAELAWKSWLQSPESGNQNAPPRRITTKSLFITPLNCPEGQRLDRNGCVQLVTVNKDEHEKILLEHLNAFFVTSAPGGDVLYDYSDSDPGPLQLNIPIGSDPEAAALQGQEPSSQAQELQPNYVKVDKKDKPDGDASIEAELELLKLQNTLNPNNTVLDSSYMVNHNILTQNYPDKPKRDSPIVNSTEIESPSNFTDEGQKELVYGHVNVDPILYNTENLTDSTEDSEPSSLTEIENNATSVNDAQQNSSIISTSETEHTSNSAAEMLKKDGDQSKLNPENDYSDIGEAIKLISRYADVTTDDNFTKEHNNNNGMIEDSVLGTRTKLQYRRNKPKEQTMEAANTPLGLAYNAKTAMHNAYPKYDVYYRYPWQSQHSQTPPPDYPFRHLQDYWPGRNQIGGVYNIHENPRRHHHSYPHNFRLHSYPHAGYAGVPPAYPEQLKGYIHHVVQHHADSMRPPANNQDLYSLLGLRHWFSSEGTSKR